MTDPAPLPLSGEELFRALVETTDALTYVVDLSEPDGPPVYVSPQLEQVFHIRPDEIGAWRPRIHQLVHPDDLQRLREAAQRTIDDGTVFDEEYRIVPDDGSVRWIRDRSHALPARDGRPPMWVGFAIDITERRARQEQARVDALHHRQLVEQLPGIVYRVTNEVPYGRTTYISPQIEDVFGYPIQRWIDEPSLWVGAIHPDDREGALEAWDASVRTGTPFEREYRLVGPDGTAMWVSERTTPLREDDGSIREWQGLVVDVSEARRAEEERALSEQRFRTLVENAPAIVFTIDPEAPNDVRYVGPQLGTILGYPAEAWRDDPSFWIGLIHPDDRQHVLDRWADAVREGRPFHDEYRMRRVDGSIAWISEHTHPAFDDDGTIIFWQGLSLDVTATKEAEVALEATGARYRALVEQLPAVVYVDTDHDRPRSLFVSSASTDVLGYPPEQYLEDHTTWPRTIHPDDRDEVLASWERSVSTGEPFETEYRFVRPDGTHVWVRDTSIRIRNEDGEQVWQGVILDVTRTVLAEREAIAAGARYRALLENIPAVVYEMGPDDERRTLYVNPQIEALLGYTRHEWLEQPDIWIELLHPDDRELVLAEHDIHNETGEPWGREYRLIAADGRIVWVRDQATLVRDADGRAVTWQGVLLDVTAQKEAEEQLRRANDELEFRVLARTSQLADANEVMALEIGERRRIEHELREAEERYRRLVETLPAVIYTWHTTPVEGVDRSYISPQIERVLGFTPAEWHADWAFWRSRLHPHDRDRVIEATDRTARTGEAFQLEYRYLAKDGRVVWVLDRATLLTRDEAGRPAIFQGVLLDITARKLAEAKAAAAEERFREVAETAPAITFVLGVDQHEPPRRTLHYVSPQIAEVLGYPMSRWVDAPEQWADVIHPDDRDAVLAASRRSFATGAPWALDYRVIAADGRIVTMHERGRCAARDETGRPSRFVGVLLDVTDHHEADRRANDDLEAATEILEGMPGVAWTELVDPETGWRRFTYISPQAKTVFGYDAAELIAEPGHFARMVHPDDRDRVLARADRSDRTGEPWVDEFRAIRRDGEVRWVHATGRRVSPQGTVPSVWHGVTVDVTELRDREPNVTSPRRRVARRAR